MGSLIQSPLGRAGQTLKLRRIAQCQCFNIDLEHWAFALAQLLELGQSRLRAAAGKDKYWPSPGGLGADRKNSAGMPSGSPYGRKRHSKAAPSSHQRKVRRRFGYRVQLGIASGIHERDSFKRGESLADRLG